MTFLAYIDGRLLKDMVLSGAALLEKNKQSIDALNVFPVPDGDTGTNMSLTMVSAVKELMGVDSASASVVAQAVARGALKGARGNSGVILSQLFRGFSKALAGVEHIDSAAMAAALQGSVEAAYKAVMKPKEGTMLTVAKALADSAQQDAQEGKDLYTLMENLLTRGNEMLKRTPDMLPVLKQAGVVDAGGAGLLAIYLGFKMAIDGASPPCRTKTPSRTSKARPRRRASSLVTAPRPSSSRSSKGLPRKTSTSCAKSSPRSAIACWWWATWR